MPLNCVHTVVTAPEARAEQTYHLEWATAQTSTKPDVFGIKILMRWTVVPLELYGAVPQQRQQNQY